MEIEEPEVAAQQFQPAVGGEVLLDELHAQIPLDDASQTAYAQAHVRGLLCRESCLAALSIQSMQEALLFQSIQGKSRFSFSDWG